MRPPPSLARIIKIRSQVEKMNNDLRNIDIYTTSREFAVEARALLLQLQHATLILGNKHREMVAEALSLPIKEGE